MSQLPAVEEAPTPRPIYDFLAGAARAAFENLSDEVKNMSEAELYQTGKITQTDWFLRKNFWKLYETALATGQAEVPTVGIYKGIMSNQNFHSRVLTNPYRVAWMLSKPIGSQEIMEEAALFGIQRLRAELLTMPINFQTAGHFLKALEFVANRAWGPIIQKLEAKHAHLNLNKPIQSGQPTNALDRLDELRGKLIESRDVTEVTTDDSGDRGT